MENLKNVWPEWEVDGEIGAGSFGKVYKIKRSDIGGTFYAALKVIKIPQDQAEVKALISEGMDKTSTSEYFRGMVEELVKEFAMMERLKGHTNIVGYEDHKVVPHEDGISYSIYIRMELLESLDNYVYNHPLSEKDVIKLGVHICRALEVCEKEHIIHRDIKPENIFVSRYGDFKLGDFGIARTAEKTTSSMSKKGTYTYMAPEVYKGQAYNKTVDIYSLGIVLYRLCNGNRAPFLPAAPAVITYSDRENALIKRMKGEPLPFFMNRCEPLWLVVQKACAYNPEERYQNATQMRQALENALKSLEGNVSPAPKAENVTNSGNNREETMDQTVGAFSSTPSTENNREETTDQTVGVFSSVPNRDNNREDQTVNQTTNQTVVTPKVEKISQDNNQKTQENTEVQRNNNPQQNSEEESIAASMIKQNNEKKKKKNLAILWVILGLSFPIVVGIIVAIVYSIIFFIVSAIMSGQAPKQNTTELANTQQESTVAHYQGPYLIDTNRTYSFMQSDSGENHYYTLENVELHLIGNPTVDSSWSDEDILEWIGYAIGNYTYEEFQEDPSTVVDEIKSQLNLKGYNKYGQRIVTGVLITGIAD